MFTSRFLLIDSYNSSKNECQFTIELKENSSIPRQRRGRKACVCVVLDRTSVCRATYSTNSYYHVHRRGEGLRRRLLSQGVESSDHLWTGGASRIQGTWDEPNNESLSMASCLVPRLLCSFPRPVVMPQCFTLSLRSFCVYSRRLFLLQKQSYVQQYSMRILNRLTRFRKRSSSTTHRLVRSRLGFATPTRRSRPAARFRPRLCAKDTRDCRCCRVGRNDRSALSPCFELTRQPVLPSAPPRFTCMTANTASLLLATAVFHMIDTVWKRTPCHLHLPT